jgi:hypothetical protein
VNGVSDRPTMTAKAARRMVRDLPRGLRVAGAAEAEGTGLSSTR